MDMCTNCTSKVMTTSPTCLDTDKVYKKVSRWSSLHPADAEDANSLGEDRYTCPDWNN